MLLSAAVACSPYAPSDREEERNATVVDSLVAVQPAKLVASDGGPTQEFGYSVAMSGNTAVVGALYGNNNAGAAYVFVRNGEAWTEEATLLVSDGMNGDLFGWSVSVSGDTAIVAARNDEHSGKYGSAYVFVRSGATWTEQAKLLPADDLDNEFGWSVSISGDTAVVGASADDDKAPNAGAAYVFVRNNGMWTQEAKLLATNGMAVDYLGTVVAISGDTVVAGAPLADTPADSAGAAHVFVRNGTWSEQAVLIADDGAIYSELGTSVSASGDTVVVGSDEAAYVFVRSGGTWMQQAKLLPSDGMVSDKFGLAVSVSGDVAVVGAPDDDDLGDASGSAYVFERAAGSWTQQGKLLASNGAAFDDFGSAVAISESTTVVGAPYSFGQTMNSGSAYAFVLKLDDGDACALAAECASGFCASGICCATACGPDGPCEESTCGTGTCSTLSKPDGSSCLDGVCIAGNCVPDPAATSGSGGQGSGGSQGNGGGGGSAGVGGGSHGGGGAIGSGASSQNGGGPLHLRGGGCSASATATARGANGLTAASLLLLAAARRRRATSPSQASLLRRRLCPKPPR